jgi:hypothetical protein
MCVRLFYSGLMSRENAPENLESPILILSLIPSSIEKHKKFYGCASVRRVLLILVLFVAFFDAFAEHATSFF